MIKKAYSDESVQGIVYKDDDHDSGLCFRNNCKVEIIYYSFQKKRFFT